MPIRAVVQSNQQAWEVGFANAVKSRDLCEIQFALLATALPPASDWANDFDRAAGNWSSSRGARYVEQLA